MFLSRAAAVFMVLDYAQFVEKFTQFAMLCVSQSSTEKKVYAEAFKIFRNSYDEIKQDAEIDAETDKLVQDLFTNIQSLLKRRKFTKETILMITRLMLNFQEENFHTIRLNLIKPLIDRAEKMTYKPLLWEKISPLYAPQGYNEIVLNSFKFVDLYLQQLLGLKPHEYYGEDLINRVFAPNSGALQLNTHTNEQAGLRNFVSGANAIFRNPSAHRQLLNSSKATFRGDGEFYATTAVVIAELISRIASELYASKIDQQITKLLEDLTVKNNWIKFVVSFAGAWAAAPLSQKTIDTFDKQNWQSSSDYRVFIELTSDKHHVFFEVDCYEDVSEDDVKSLCKEIKILTDLPVKTAKKRNV